MSMRAVDQNARPELKRFKLVEKTTQASHSRFRRDPMGVKVGPTGIATVNVAGTELFNSLARAEGLDEQAYSVVFGSDAEAGQVAAIVVEPDTIGATAVRREPAKKTITLYLENLFSEAPELRPPSARWCQIEKTPDGADGYFVLIHLSQGLERRKIKRSLKKPATMPSP